MSRTGKYNIKNPPSGAFTVYKERRERSYSTDAAKAEIEADNAAADAKVAATLEKRRKRDKGRADRAVGRLVAKQKGENVDMNFATREIKALARTSFGRQALLAACKNQGIDIDTYAEMLALSAKVGRDTGNPDAVASRRHVTKSLENLHEVGQRQDADRQGLVVNIIVSDPFRNVENPRNTGYTVVDGEGETPAGGD